MYFLTSYVKGKRKNNNRQYMETFVAIKKVCVMFSFILTRVNNINISYSILYVSENITLANTIWP